MTFDGKKQQLCKTKQGKLQNPSIHWCLTEPDCEFGTAAL